ncbi:MAG: pilus assembly protein TadG-related protein [Kiritimatiellaeota bacterium]|nr:pilus assembly protein TadG-related protein [Kiritimatiellota bacterium]
MRRRMLDGSSLPGQATMGSDGSANPNVAPVCRRQAGQAIIFLLLAFTVLAFFLMFQVDLHRIIQRKNQVQNAGDAAALATARWQASSLNLIGELNLLHVLALAVLPEPDTAAVDAITNMQARLSFTGPLAAFYAAQVAAKNNHIYVDPDLTSYYQGHAATIRHQYAALLNADGDQYFPEPWSGAWQEYADILDVICADGLAAGPDNARFFSDPGGGHVLFRKDFYYAVTGMNWCWFHFNQKGLLESYHSYHDWPPIPNLDERDYTNSEIFSLGLHPLTERMARLYQTSELVDRIEAANLLDQLVNPIDTTNVTDSVETWYMYNQGHWAEWEDIKATGEIVFPAAGEIRPEYDYVGADAVLRVSAPVDRIMPEGGRRQNRTPSSSVANWTAASKPFGFLDDGTARIRPNAPPGLVLPAFHSVRLIPADTASNSDAFSSDIEWVIHLKAHLRPYMDLGTTEPNCRYCNALVMWEPQPFRQIGIDWLKENSSKCRLPSGGGGGGGGGGRRGH